MIRIALLLYTLAFGAGIAAAPTAETAVTPEPISPREESAAPAVLLVLAKKNTPFTVADGSLSMGNMMLAAHALGLGSCWINRAREEFETEEGREILRSLGVEGEYEGVGHCVVGYPAGELPKAAPRKDGRVFWAE